MRLLLLHRRKRKGGSPLRAGTSPRLLRVRVGGLVELAFADDRAFLGSALLAALELDLLLFGFLDLGDGNDMLAVGHPEDGHAHRVAARDADVADCGADHLALVGYQHQLLAW